MLDVIEIYEVLFNIIAPPPLFRGYWNLEHRFGVCYECQLETIGLNITSSPYTLQNSQYQSHFSFVLLKNVLHPEIHNQAQEQEPVHVDCCENGKTAEVVVVACTLNCTATTLHLTLPVKKRELIK